MIIIREYFDGYAAETAMADFDAIIEAAMWGDSPIGEWLPSGSRNGESGRHMAVFRHRKTGAEALVYEWNGRVRAECADARHDLKPLLAIGQ